MPNKNEVPGDAGHKVSDFKGVEDMKEIEELADLISCYCYGCPYVDSCKIDEGEYCRVGLEQAEAILKAGYRKPAEADVEKIAQKLASEFDTGISWECLFGSTKEQYRKIARQLLPLLSPKPLKLISDEEIFEVVLKVGANEGFNKKEGYHRVQAEEYVKGGAQAQLSADQARLEGRWKRIISENR